MTVTLKVTVTLIIDEKRISSVVERKQSKPPRRKAILLQKFVCALVVSIRPSSPLRFAQDYSTTDEGMKEDVM